MPYAVALGCFDGVHRGHAALIAAAAREAAARGLDLLAWSLVRPTPDGFLCPPRSRRELLRSAGASDVFLAPFEQVRDLSPERFVREILRERFSAELALCGENFRFGAGARGDARTLRRLMREADGDALFLPLLRAPLLPSEREPLREGGDRAASPRERSPASPARASSLSTPGDNQDYTPISSSRARALLAAGDPAGAAALLGRHFTVAGNVARGRGIGRTLGVPTANLPFPQGLTVPRHGVYLARAVLEDGAELDAVCNLGVRPTVEERGDILLECHLLGFAGDLVGRRLRVELRDFLRPERRFPDLPSLRVAALADVQRAKEMTRLG